LLTDKGLIRVRLGVSPVAEFVVTAVDDPHGCNTNPATGIPSGILSVYRRPLPTTNIGFLSAIMWDGREPSLENQAVDATFVHAQAAAPPTAAPRRPRAVLAIALGSVLLALASSISP